MTVILWLNQVLYLSILKFLLGVTKCFVCGTFIFKKKCVDLKILFFVCVVKKMIQEYLFDLTYKFIFCGLSLLWAE